MIEAQNVFLKYPDGTEALKEINFQVGKGKIVYVTGPSGSGKTSLLKLLMGMELPTYGCLRVLGVDIRKSSSKEIRDLRRMIGPVFQEFRLIKGRTAIENVILGMRFIGIPPNQLKERAMDALLRVGLGSKVFSPVENLSWGEGQRVAIARAIARSPKLILADEPTGNLDKENSMKIIELLESFKDEDTTVFITTHATHLIEDRIDGLLMEVDNGNISVGRVEMI